MMEKATIAGIDLHFAKIHVEHDAGCRTLWVYFSADGVPSYTVAVLEDLHALCSGIKRIFDRAAGGRPPLDFLVLASRMPGIFNMGGDLAHIGRLSGDRDRAGLERYGRLTADMVHMMWSALDLPLVTVSAVDGDAFGGGFEAALSTQFMIAGPSARFSFPEIRFGLFPGMGATSLLSRRTTKALTEAMILEGTIINSPDALTLGICDYALGKGTAARLVRTVTRRMSEEKRLTLLRLASARMAAGRYTLGEARDVVGEWVEAVLNLDERGRRHIGKIVGAQRARVSRSASADIR
jgi:DSF synthase